MSIFQFLASDKQLHERKNPYIEYISINEALKRNVEMPSFILEDTDVDKDEKNIMYCDSEEHLNELEINHDLYYSVEYAQEYTDKPFVSELQWRYTKARAQQLIDYLVDQLQHVDEIEVWSIWLDEQEPAMIRTVLAAELKVSNLDFLDGTKGFLRPECLIVKK
ncbi:MAG: hypothetical protein LRY71_11335 [Bacillaceae bacterium]|nr:hypothetical protein [Bacillaceae bacterium]